jgi:hypothetical protein
MRQVSLDIGAEDRSQLALCPLFGHRLTSSVTKKPPSGYSSPLAAFLLTTFWKRISMVSSKKVGGMLLILQELNGMKLTQPD